MTVDVSLESIGVDTLDTWGTPDRGSRTPLPVPLIEQKRVDQLSLVFLGILLVSSLLLVIV